MCSDFNPSVKTFFKVVCVIILRFSDNQTHKVRKRVKNIESNPDFYFKATHFFNVLTLNTVSEIPDFIHVYCSFYSLHKIPGFGRFLVKLTHNRDKIDKDMENFTFIIIQELGENRIFWVSEKHIYTYIYS